MSAAPSRRDEGGMSLVEVVIAMLVFGVVMSGALGFLSVQNRAFHRGLDRMTAMQGSRYALQVLSTDLMTLGTNLPNSQPALVYAGPDVIVFNADYASNVENDVFASYFDPDAPTGEVTAMRRPITLPNTSVRYPDTLYTTRARTASPGETIIFWFALDSATARSDDYALLRQVNSTQPEVVARHILGSSRTPFFRYLRRKDFASAASVVDSIPDSALPIRHWFAMHGLPGDTGTSALADSIRGVRVSFRTSNGLEGPQERISEVSRVITFPNAGLGTFTTCGSEPILGQPLTAVAVDRGGGEWAINLLWLPATDEGGGERDVARYVIYRQEGTFTSDWGDPYLSIPAGEAAYTYSDQAVEVGDLYRYALAAQDCTPSLSNDLAVTPIISVP